MVRVVRLRFLRMDSRVGWLVCVRRLLPLIPPPTGLVLGLVRLFGWLLLVSNWLFFLFHTIIFMVILYTILKDACNRVFFIFLVLVVN